MKVRTIAMQVAVARAAVENLRPDEVAAECRTGRVQLVDLREPHEAAAGVIAGAVVVPRGLLEFAADPNATGHVAALHPTARVIVYCDHGARSALAVHTLYGLGYRDVAHLDGGVVAWTAAGYPLSVPRTG